MLEAFLSSALKQLNERLVALKSERPRTLPAEYDLALRAISHEVDRLVTEVTELLNDHEDSRLTVSSVVGEYRILVAEAARLESVFMPAIANATEGDIALTRLLRRVHGEIGFPLLCPAVTRSSQELYWIDGEFHLIGVPFREDHSPLALPVLFHELGHLLFSESNDKKVQPFEDAMIAVGTSVTTYFRPREIGASRRRGQGFVEGRYKAWRHLWIRHWIEELCCDAFAIFVGGPAYAWAFIHSAIAFGIDPFELPGLSADNEHPADDARVSVMLAVLRHCGFSAEADEISMFWRMAVESLGSSIDEEFKQCYPSNSLNVVAKQMIAASEGSGCRRFTPEERGTVRLALLEYWKRSLKGESIESDWQAQIAATDRGESE